GLDMARKKFFNLAILDIKLPDMEGTELLAKIHKEKPEMMKVMLTGYPSLDNAVQALNLGADAYLMKPVNPEELLRVVEEKLREQSEAESMTEEKVAEWIEKRIQKLEQQK
ncbi:MAG: response regulator, partial [Nitrososphaeria archaeon]